MNDITEPYITCPRCARTSYHPGDIANKYCGNCHAYHDQIAVAGIAQIRPCIQVPFSRVVAVHDYLRAISDSRVSLDSRMPVSADADFHGAAMVLCWLLGDPAGAVFEEAITRVAVLLEKRGFTPAKNPCILTDRARRRLKQHKPIPTRTAALLDQVLTELPPETPPDLAAAAKQLRDYLMNEHDMKIEIRPRT